MPNTSGSITAAQFIAKWAKVQLPERAASQEHFLDLCRLLGQPTPAEHDATGAEYTFEKGVQVTGPASARSKGDYGFADVWWADKFGWEYKTKDKYKDLDAAYRQLLQYREALGNPPLLIVSDISRIVIHTNFTSTVKQKIEIPLAKLAEGDNLAILRRVFTDPFGFKPKLTLEQITRDVAVDFGKLAQLIEKRGHDPQDVAHFLMKCMFCLFAEDVGLLPANLFNDTVRQWQDDPSQLTPVLTDLFAKMKSGGAFGPVKIEWFNGGLFDDAPAIALTRSEIGTLLIASGRDWSQVEPAIFGTLFERSLNPAKRSQIGAHYTSRDDILLIVEPVVMAPLRKRWDETRAQVENQLERRRKAKTPATKRKADQRIDKLFDDLMGELASVRILDPACGSGNFLYVAIQQLLNLEKEIYTYAAQPHIAVSLFPNIRPTQLHGIEINPFAAELAKVVIWIGYLQWMRDNGFVESKRPILDPLNTIECRDAILDRSDPGHPAVAEWPDADFIIGNPPFLGSKLFRDAGIPDDYIDAMYSAYEIPNSSDLCCYWFERARMVIAKHTRAGSPASPESPRVGLLATQGIRGGTNREVLKRIKQSGDIFMAWADRKWILDGAAVQVSMVGFDDGREHEHVLNGVELERIHSNLTTGADLTVARKLPQNVGLAFRGNEKGGQFDVDLETARELLTVPNPHPHSNFDVMKPYVNGREIMGRPLGRWLIDFGIEASRVQAAQYEAPFQYLDEHVKPVRAGNRREQLREYWWLHRGTRADMRSAVEAKNRYIATVRHSKYRAFVWLNSVLLLDDAAVAIARSDDYFFGVLHSSVHELWARRMGTQLREAESGFRYTPTTCFETFALPWSPGDEPTDVAPDATSRGRQPADGGGRADASGAARTVRELPLAADAYARIAEAAEQLNEQRERWLNPPEWIDPIAETVDRFDDFADVPEDARPLIRESAIAAMAAKDARLKKRTLTNLYNQRPEWLKNAHEQLDRAVLAAYAATDPQGGWDEQWAQVWRETGAGRPLPDDSPLTAHRAAVEQQVLAALLALNQARQAS